MVARSSARHFDIDDVDGSEVGAGPPWPEGRDCRGRIDAITKVPNHYRINVRTANSGS